MPAERQRSISSEYVSELTARIGSSAPPDADRTIRTKSATAISSRSTLTSKQAQSRPDRLDTIAGAVSLATTCSPQSCKSTLASSRLANSGSSTAMQVSRQHARNRSAADDDAAASRRGAGSATSRRRTVASKTLPLPGVLSNETSPPIRFASARHSDNPRPLPPWARRLELSCCSKG